MIVSVSYVISYVNMSVNRLCHLVRKYNSVNRLCHLVCKYDSVNILCHLVCKYDSVSRLCHLVCASEGVGDFPVLHFLPVFDFISHFYQ